MRYEITTRGEETRVMFFDEIKELDITRTEQVKELEREEFTVIVNLLQKLPFGFNLEEKCFYLDIEDVDANTAQLDKLTELTEGLDDKKDKEKIKKIMEEHHIQFVKRQKVVIATGDKKDLAEMVVEFIVDNNV